MGLLDLIFGTNSNKVKAFKNNGAVILDVRTRNEYVAGHVQHSINIPLSELKTKIAEIKNLEKPVITCCKSGVRSAKARNYLNSVGVNAMNGGSWKSLV